MARSNFRTTKFAFFLLKVCNSSLSKHYSRSKMLVALEVVDFEPQLVQVQTRICPNGAGGFDAKGIIRICHFVDSGQNNKT